MSTRIGLGLASDAIRAVAVRQGRIVWAADAAYEQDAGLKPAIHALLRLAPVRRFPRPVLSAAVGPHASQLKVLAGLPTVSDGATLAALIRENAGSFFLRNGVSLVTSGVPLAEPGTALGSAVEEPWVRAVQEVCASLRWRCNAVVPTPRVLADVVADDCFAWSDGTLVVEVTRARGAIASVRTRLRNAAEPAPRQPEPVPGLAALGDGAVRFADAYGAAMLDPDGGRGLGSSRATRWDPVEVRRRLFLPGVLLALGIVSWLGSPLAAAWARGRADARLAAVRPEQRQVVASTLARLDTVNRVVGRARRFAASRALVTPTLGALTGALPEGCVVVELELNDRHGNLTALCESAAEVVTAVQGVPDVRAVELAGPVRRESGPGRETQRVAVRWRRDAP